MTNNDILRDIRKDNSIYIELKSLEEFLTKKDINNQCYQEKSISKEEFEFLRNCAIQIKKHKEE